MLTSSSATATAPPTTATSLTIAVTTALSLSVAPALTIALATTIRLTLTAALKPTATSFADAASVASTATRTLGLARNLGQVRGYYAGHRTERRRPGDQGGRHPEREPRLLCMSQSMYHDHALNRPEFCMRSWYVHNLPGDMPP